MVGGHDLAVMINQTPYIQKVQGDSQSLLITSQENLNKEVLKKQEDESKEVLRSNESQRSMQVNQEQEREAKKEKKSRKKSRKKKDQENFISETDKGKIINILV